MPGSIEELAPSVFGIEREFEIDRESWSRYKLLDGGEIRVKTTVLKIYAIVDANGHQKSDPATGVPIFGTTHKSEIVFSR